MSCPFCGTGTDLPHETQAACITALHSEISRIRHVVERLNGPAFASASAKQAPAVAVASARQVPAVAEASARQAPAVAEASVPQTASDRISGDNPKPQAPPDKRG